MPQVPPDPPPEPTLSTPAGGPGSPSASQAMEQTLADLRVRIDSIDEAIVKLMAERASLVVEVGHAKRAGGGAIYAPHREREVIERAVRRNPGPLQARTVEAVFREIMSGSFALERPLRIGYLGPPGTFSHLAAVRHFGSSVEYADLSEISLVFEEITKGHIHYGLVPYENSIGGSVTETLDAFQEHAVTIAAEALVEVNQVLLANCAPNEIRRIHSRGEVFAQCRHWLSRRYPQAELVPEASTAAAAKIAASEASSGAAAIGSPIAGEIYGLHVLFEGIQDRAGNVTRFLVIGREPSRPSGRDKTTIMFAAQHTPGALVEVLDAFRRQKLNLSHIEKRPSSRENWRYIFFIDVEAHRDDPALQLAIADASAHCLSLTVLGSYPQAERIL
ncbi:MAG: prephenate dehydratase [Phycisphaeraceae bacterium]|nr:prephenate dehydratase [Phycisphaeraceae bacterium]